MSEALDWGVLVALVAAVAAGLYEGARLFAGGLPRRPPRALRPVVTAVTDALVRGGFLRRPAPKEPVPPVLLVLELRRLAAEVRRIEADTTAPHRAARLFAVLAAYDHVLVQLCATADVPTPIGLLPLDPRDRLDLEVDLVATGVDW
jgi:hypothetical protein